MRPLTSRGHDLVNVGGGLGLSGGSALVTNTTWIGTKAESLGHDAWGGGLGMHLSTETVNVYDSTFIGCIAKGTASGPGLLGGVGGSVGGGLEGPRAELFNVSLIDSIASSRALGTVLFGWSVRSALVHIRQACPPLDEGITALIGTNSRGTRTMLVRALSIEAMTDAAPDHVHCPSIMPVEAGTELVRGARSNPYYLHPELPEVCLPAACAPSFE